MTAEEIAAEFRKNPDLFLEACRIVSTPWDQGCGFPYINGFKALAGKPLPHADANYPHAIITPFGSYAPWMADQKFRDIYEKMNPGGYFGGGGYTMVDTARAYSIWSLVRQVAHLPGDIVEVGCWKGGISAMIRRALAEVAPKKTIFACDTFQGVVKAGDKDTVYKGGEHLNQSKDIVHEAMAIAGGPAPYEILAGIFPDDTGHAVKGRKICFAHLDTDVYQGQRDSFEAIWPKMPKGGIIVMDDYGFDTTPGATRFGNEVAQRDDLVFIYNLNAQGIAVKTR